MSTTRRNLIRLGASALAFAACRRADPGAAEALPVPGEGGSLSILVLGGTGFLGPHFVEAALARGHRPTLFNRGKTNPHLFPELEKLHGDRKTGDLAALEGREFDVVVDNSGYLPKHVEQSAKLLASSRQYLFVSSVSAFRDQGKTGLVETDPVAPLDDPTTEDVATHYGALKAACERAAEQAMPGRVTVVRPGLIVGPGDPTDRFTYWPVRVAQGGEVLAPGNPLDPVQLIDVRDLAAFMLHTLEHGQFGVYSAVGPSEGLSVGAMLDACKRAAGSDASFTWADASFLAEQAVEPWSQMTVWVPPGSDFAGLGSVDGRKAWSAGLVNRDIVATARDTLSWWNEQPSERRAEPRAGLAAAREAEVLALWKAKGGSASAA